MNEQVFALPTLFVLAPAAGALVMMVLGNRVLSLIAMLITATVQVVFIGVAIGQLRNHADAFGDAATASCVIPGSGNTFVLAHCSEWFPQLGIDYNVAIGWASLGLIALVTVVTTCASLFAILVNRQRVSVLIGLMWLSAAALCGLFVARDLVLFYVYFEAMLIPMLIAVGVWGGLRRVSATMSMFVYTLAGSLPMLVGVVATGIESRNAITAANANGFGQGFSPFSLPDIAELVAAGYLDISGWILASFLLAFAIKAPLIPFHGWLPVAYREAPVEVAAMLSGLISKAAFFGVLVVVLPLAPGLLDGAWGTVFLWFALATLMYGSIAAFRQPDPRGVVAYSSIAQMGLIMLGVAVFMGDGGQQGISGAYLQTINHGLVSALLFLLVGIVERRTGESVFARMGGLASGRPVLASIGLFAALVALAVPGASTFAGELLILAGVFQGSVAGPLVAGIAALAVVLAALYALRLIAGIAFSPDAGTSTQAAPGANNFGADISKKELSLLAPLVVVLIALSVWPNVVQRAMDQPPVQLSSAPALVSASSSDSGVNKDQP